MGAEAEVIHSLTVCVVSAADGAVIRQIRNKYRKLFIGTCQRYGNKNTDWHSRFYLTVASMPTREYTSPHADYAEYFEWRIGILIMRTEQDIL